MFDGLAHGNSLSILEAQEFLIESADQRAAADKRCAEANSFFFGEADDFNPERKPSPFQGLQQCDGEDDAKNAVVGSRVGDGVEMRTQQKPRCFGLRRGIERAQVSGGVNSHLGSEWFQPSRDFVVTVTHGRGEKSPARAAEDFAEAGELLASGDDFSCAICGAAVCLHCL